MGELVADVPLSVTIPRYVLVSSKSSVTSHSTGVDQDLVSQTWAGTPLGPQSTSGTDSRRWISIVSVDFFDHWEIVPIFGCEYRINDLWVTSVTVVQFINMQMLHAFSKLPPFFVSFKCHLMTFSLDYIASFSIACFTERPVWNMQYKNYLVLF